MFSHQDSTGCYICKRKFTQKLAKNKNYCEVKNHCSFIVKIEVQDIIVNVI